MTFHEKLNEYMEQLSCSGKELSERTGISPAVISRYRTGDRLPSRDSLQLKKICASLSELAIEAGMTNLTEKSIFRTLEETLPETNFDFALMSKNLNTLISMLDININELARFMNYDSSYISRIRSGQRKPAEPEAFIDGVCSFVRRRFAHGEANAVLSGLFNCSPDSLTDSARLQDELKNWLCQNHPKQADPVVEFLSRLDVFDLNEYIRSIHFDRLKVPTAPFQLPTSKNYYGLEHMKTGELDFLKATVLSKSMDPVFMCSDMPMSDIAADLEFGKKWMYGIALMLKKGLHLNIIHNLDRPFPELMLGLESWIPLYMTGQVSPYYLQGLHNSVYCHLNYVSGTAALTGECIVGCHEKGKYYLTNNHEELNFYKKKAAELLRLSKPLMEIYRADSAAAFDAFLMDASHINGSCWGILSSPPLHTISDGLLNRILTRCKLPSFQVERIRTHVQKQREAALLMLENNTVSDELYCLSLEEFKRSPVVLHLAGAFYDHDIHYTWEEYSEHIALTEEYSKHHTNYTVSFRAFRGFSNIQIITRENSYALISKSNSPAIHFVIRHPKLLSALENMVIPVVEDVEK